MRRLHLLDRGKVFLLALACGLSACASPPAKDTLECRSLAGSPDEPESNGKGVTLDQITYQAANACFISYGHSGTTEDAYHMGRADAALGKYTGTFGALDMYMRAAKDDYAPAQNAIGDLYDKGLGVQKDSSKALMWYRKAADQGNFAAKKNLARMYETGDGVPIDAKRAMELYRDLAEEGYADAQLSLAKSYFAGSGVEQDYSEAVKWFRKAAENGNTEAQDELGQMYQKGVGVNKDPSQSFIWYRKAAENNDPYAQVHVAALYYNGNGAEKDFKAALSWYQKAVKTLKDRFLSKQIAGKDQEAEKKLLSKAESSLGWMYQHGEGTPVSLPMAGMQYAYASDLGNHFAKLQNTIMGLETAFKMPYGAAWGRRKHEMIEQGLSDLNELAFDEDPNVAKGAKEALAKIPQKDIDEDKKREQEREYGFAVGGAILTLFLLETQCLNTELPDTTENVLCENGK